MNSRVPSKERGWGPGPQLSWRLGEGAGLAACLCCPLTSPAFRERLSVARAPILATGANQARLPPPPSRLLPAPASPPCWSTLWLNISLCQACPSQTSMGCRSTSLHLGSLGCPFQACCLPVKWPQMHTEDPKGQQGWHLTANH